VVDFQPRKPQQLEYKEQRKITCCRRQHPPTWGSDIWHKQHMTKA